jgi:hypothetical protein
MSKFTFPTSHDDRPKRHGWAPGNYIGRCGQCGENYFGDKRSCMCAECAYAMPDPVPPKPERAHTIILKAGADTAEDLARELESLAFDIRCGKLTVGCNGSPSRGSVYSYAQDPTMTHDAYFRALDAHLKGSRAQ